jgi:hypothetical protein
LRYRRIGPVFDTGYGNAVNVIRTRDYEQTGCRRHPPRGPGHPQALRAPVGQKRGCRRSTSWRSSTPPSPDIGCLKADTGPPCCDAALRVPSGNSSHLRARFDLTTHGKIPAARLGCAARKAGSHLWLPPLVADALGGEGCDFPIAKACALISRAFDLSRYTRLPSPPPLRLA